MIQLAAVNPSSTVCIATIVVVKNLNVRYVPSAVNLNAEVLSVMVFGYISSYIPSDRKSIHPYSRPI